jgi:hypothetical protein
MRSPRHRTRRRPRPPEIEARRTAALLASGQLFECFVALASTGIRGSVDREVLACWAQELVVRGHDLSREARVVELWREITRAGHPLARLPLCPSPLESTLRGVLPRVSLRGSSSALPFGPKARVVTPPPRPAIGVVRAAAASSDVTAAIAGWLEASNGTAEARLYVAAEALGPLDAALLVSLAPECLADADEMSCAAIDGAAALTLLFAAAANDGAYGGALGGAYGRLAAWTSLAALAGEHGDLDIDRARVAVAATSLARFDAKSAWFRQVAWDFGIACLRSDERTLALLAATDTD